MTKRIHVAFEGIDGAGKTTQVRLFTAALRSLHRKVTVHVEPTSGKFGAEIRRRASGGPPMTAQEELDLFLSDRKEGVERVVRPALERGDDLVQDRSYFSTAAYQETRSDLGLTMDDLISMNSFAPKPSLVILLDLEAHEACRRIALRGSPTTFEVESRLRQVRHNFLYLAGRAKNSGLIRRVSANATPEDVRLQVWGHFRAWLMDSGAAWTDLPVVPGQRCDDGGRCNHSCKDGDCFRRRHASPLSDTGFASWVELDDADGIHG